MTENDWLESRCPTRVIQFLKGIASDRKLRLFACACARRTWDEVPEARCRNAVEVAERYTDGLATADELALAKRPIWRVAKEMAKERPEDPFPYHLIASGDCASPDAFDAAYTGSFDAGWSYENGVWLSESAQYEALAKLAHDVFGNPFRPVVLSPSWRTDTALILALQTYDSRDYRTMPLLADALQDAGCEDGQILNHCRDANQVHVRGCWVVDLVLGKQ